MPDVETARDEHLDGLLAKLDAELSLLPDRYRIPIVLCELEGKTHREAADQLGWPIGTVSGRLSRGRALLAKRLSRPGLRVSTGELAMMLSHNATFAVMPARLLGTTSKSREFDRGGASGIGGVVLRRSRGPDRRSAKDHVAF